ncbi:MAG: URC4/urg3 family protein [Zoogloeaceae bacterium]|nr:URC4/urg3 family protein [Zoogloeaceae bacterium]
MKPGPEWLGGVPDHHPAAALLTAGAIRARCGAVLDHVERGMSPFFRWRPDRIPAAADYVAQTIRQNYPTLAVPYHSRWRHFEAGGVDRWGKLVIDAGLTADPLERSRVAIDLVIPSVLLDAGAGPHWHYKEPGRHQVLTRSEGLAVASLALFASGALSGDPRRHHRCDAQALDRLIPEHVALLFQVGPANPMVGVEGRTELLRRLGTVMGAHAEVFGTPARAGHLLDYLLTHADGGTLEAEFVLVTLLRVLGPVWPGRIELDGVSLGDCWSHPAPSDGLVPFHKLTQWLTYSLLEPLEWAGLKVTGLDCLTGLPEYRNGGLLLDFGVIEPKDPGFWAQDWTVDAAPVVEWRALTVMGLDLLAGAVREELGVSAEAFPLARVLEGGTWAAGRRIAAQRRPGGEPPLRIRSDGTVF